MKTAAIGTLTVAILALILYGVAQHSEDVPATELPIEFDPVQDELLSRFAEPGSILTQATEVTANASGEYGCTAKDVEEVQERAADRDNIAGRTAALINTLSQSTAGEHVFVAALLSRHDDPGAAMEYVRRALRLSPKNPAVLFRASELCLGGRYGEMCAAPDIRANVDAVLGNNGAYWARVAAHRYNRGQAASALVALERAAVSPRMDFYWAETIILIERGLAVSNDFGYLERIRWALGMAAVMPGEETELYRICKTVAADQSVWYDACLGYANRLAGDARTLLTRRIGLGIQQHLFEIAGRVDDLNDVLSRQTALRDKINWGDDAQLIFMSDERFVARYIDELLVNGEIAAIDFAVAEISRLKDDSSYDPCALAGIGSTDN